MKRILYNIQSILLLVILSQITLSCSETEELEPQSIDITFTAAIQNDVRTRAEEGYFTYGGGKHATTLLVAVFNDNETPQMVGKPQEFTIDPLSSYGNSVIINLTKNQTYNIIFWAYNKEADGYDFKNLPDIKMKTTDKAMTFEKADAMDAFYAVVRYTAGNTPEPISLKRPLAQINVGTSGTATATKFTVYETADTFHPFTETVSGKTNFTWTFAEPTTETFSVWIDKKEYTYNYLALGYLFAPLGEKTEAAKKTCLLELTGTDKEIPPFQDVELHADYRSNIVGSFTK